MPRSAPPHWIPAFAGMTGVGLVGRWGDGFGRGLVCVDSCLRRNDGEGWLADEAFAVF